MYYSAEGTANPPAILYLNDGMTGGATIFPGPALRSLLQVARC